MPDNSKPDGLLLELRGLTKQFPGVVALNAVDLSLAPGEIHALVGENGAGKSTLIKLLCGSYVPDDGEMWFNGEPYRPGSPLDALKAGIRVVYQEFNLLPYLSVAENLLFDSLPRRYGLLVDHGKLPHGISFALRYGEIVGLAGPVGSGRTETLRAIFGADSCDGGEIYRQGRRVYFDNPRDAVEHGVCLLTENRKEDLCFLCRYESTSR
jgi:ABC-type sugar transport system ATPase subunit